MMLSIQKITIKSVAILLSIFLIYTSYFGTFYPFLQRAVPLTCCMFLVFLTIDFRRKDKSKSISIIDFSLSLISIPIFGYAAFYSDYLANRWPMSRMSEPTNLEIAFGILAIILLLEAVRRTIGFALVAVVLLMLAYTMFGNSIPIQSLSHPGYSIVDALDHYYLTMEGIWGSTLGIAATYVSLFVIFGAFMKASGTTQFFVDLANSIAGESAGGPAKVAVVASGLVGSVTGSTVANVYTTGQLSIPLMKQVGYKPSFSGAVEALASNGGQLMPPIMGAAAFLLASNAGVPYFEVMKASIIPALLYFTTLIWFIHLEAKKQGLEGLVKGSTPKALSVLKQRGYLLAPLFLLIILLARGYSPLLSGFYAIFLLILVSWLRIETRINFNKFIIALEEGARNSVLIIVVCAAVGLVVGTFTLTGLALTISSSIINVTGGNIIWVLLLVTLAALVLGTGMNTVAAFILVSVAAVPAITAQDVDIFPANMFVFHVSLLSMITPPVCLAVFAGAAIAGANIWETAFQAMKLGIVAYLLPWIIIFQPGVMLLGNASEIVFDTICALTLFFCLVCFTQSYIFTTVNIFQRLVLLICSLSIFIGNTNIKSLAIFGAICLFVLSWRMSGRAKNYLMKRAD